MYGKPPRFIVFSCVLLSLQLTCFRLHVMSSQSQDREAPDPPPSAVNNPEISDEKSRQNHYGGTKKTLQFWLVFRECRPAMFLSPHKGALLCFCTTPRESFIYRALLK